MPNLFVLLQNPCPMFQGEFACKNGMCISDAWRCDGNNDCGDMSDEIGCPICTPPMLSCDEDTRCYLENWKCDGDADCVDMSDEKGEDCFFYLFLDIGESVIVSVRASALGYPEKRKYPHLAVDTF